MSFSNFQTHPSQWVLRYFSCPGCLALVRHHVLVGAKWGLTPTDPITGLEDWIDFNYNTLMQSHGHVLGQQVPPMPETSPPLTQLEREIFTEDTFETVLDREIMPQVSAALRVAWPLSYSNHNPKDIAETSKGRKQGEEQQRKTTDSMRTGLVSEKVKKQYLVIRTSAPEILNSQQNGVRPKKADGDQTILRPSVRSKLIAGANGVLYSSWLYYNSRRTCRNLGFQGISWARVSRIKASPNPNAASTRSTVSLTHIFHRDRQLRVTSNVYGHGIEFQRRCQSKY